MIPAQNVLLILTLTMLNWSCSVQASPNPDFQTIDAHARQAPSSVTKNVEKLTQYLVKPAKNDTEKVRSFYVWIAENISYDVKAFMHYNPSRYQPVAPNEVLKQRKAVCQGYADLFQEMCHLVDIPSRIVPGYSKGFGYQGDHTFDNADHAWNAVRIDEQWHLLDVTWASGGINDQLRFVKNYQDRFFLPDPTKFIQDHMPLDPMWQLLDCPVSMSAFRQGEKAVEEALNNKKKCTDVEKTIQADEQLPATEQALQSAIRSYAFNPTNHLTIVRGYMNYAHHLMLGIPKQLRSKEAIEQAITVQEEALNYLNKAAQIVKKVKSDQGELERKTLTFNIENSKNNLKGLRDALQ